MYVVNAEIEGIAPLLQHRFPMPDLAEMGKGSKKQTGATDYTAEWKEYFYANPQGVIYQPATHIEAAMISAAVNFKVSGKRGKTYKDLFKAAVFVTPEELSHGVMVPATLTPEGDGRLFLDARPVVVNRARVIRMRPGFCAGWKLEFAIEVIDDSLHPEVVNEVLVLAGRTVGIGDYRPRFGRFMVTRFEKER